MPIALGPMPNNSAYLAMVSDMMGRLRKTDVAPKKLKELVMCWYCGGLNFDDAHKCEHCGGPIRANT